MVIRITERQQSADPIPGAKVQNSADANAFGAPVFRATENLGEVLKRKAADLEDADTLEAMNRFRQDVERHHNDPDKGLYNTRLGRDAEGLYADADKWMDNKAFEYAGKLRSTRASENFLKMAKQHWTHQNMANSRFEANQVRAYRDAEAKAAIDLGMNDIALNYADDAAVADAEARMTMALELQTRGLGDDAKKLALQNMQSGIALTRFGKMLEADPEQAGAWLEANKDSMNADARSKAQNALTRTMEKVEAERQIFRTQEFVDGFVQEYGPGREQEGIAKIRETHAGPEEEKYVTAYKTRINEMKVKEGNADAELRKVQNQNFDTLKRDYYQKGIIPSQQQLDADLDAGNINVDHYRTAMSWNEVMATRSDITRNLSKNDPTWNNMTAEEQESKVMRAAGKTPEQRASVLERIKSGVLDGTVTDADLDAEYNNMNITRAERDYYKAMDTKFGKEQKDFVAQQKRDLITDIATIDIPGKNGAMYRGVAQSVFTDKVGQLDPQSKTYRMDVMDARRAAIVAAVEASGKDLERSTWFGFGAREKTKFGQRVSDALTSLEETTGNIQEYRPETYESKVDLTPRPGEGSVYKKGLPQPPASIPAAVNQSIASHADTYKGKKYTLGGKDMKGKGVDCSGLVCSVMGDVVSDVNKNAGYEVFDANARKALKGASADIVENVAKATGFELTNPDPGQLREGMIIGLDADGGAGGRGYKGIDHIGVVMRDPATGQLQIYESNSKQGVTKADAAEYVNRYIGKGRKVYAVDPMLMAKQKQQPQPPKAASQATPPSPTQGRVGPTRENAAAPKAQGRVGPTIENEAALRGRPTLKSILDGE